jgi:hypothetical protein
MVMHVVVHSLLAAFAAGCANAALCDEKPRKDYVELKQLKLRVPDFARAHPGYETNAIIAGLDRQSTSCLRDKAGMRGSSPRMAAPSADPAVIGWRGGANHGRAWR